MPAKKTTPKTKAAKRTKAAAPKKKKCRTCGKTKQVKTKSGTNFWRNARSKDGLRDQCKDCFYEYRNAAKEEAEAS